MIAVFLGSFAVFFSIRAIALSVVGSMAGAATMATMATLTAVTAVTAVTAGSTV